MPLGVSFSFGMNSFTGNDYDEGTAPATTYAPDQLNVDQWLAAAEELGARYAILTAKHMSGFCLWDAKDYSYDVTQSGNHTDVVLEFVRACRKRHIVPGMYYCILDPRNENNQGHVDWEGKVQEPYYSVILKQLRELHTLYGPIGMQVIDIPGKLSSEERWQLYRTVKTLAPHCLIMVNQTWQISQYNRGRICAPDAWPTDIILSEDAVPVSTHDPHVEFEGKPYYMPMASWIPAGPFYRNDKYRQWFWSPGFKPRPAAELFDLYRQTVPRNASFLLNLSPDAHGLVCDDQLEELHRLSHLIKPARAHSSAERVRSGETR
jgi:alpha-L-fucosidase